ncbi:hypothetical protein [Shewanella sp. 1180_01]|uniref:hypothetical protein n=1 Tax=Shewanella sp. 1180_01 TaxID=2604451 RepID=UPI0040635C11
MEKVALGHHKLLNYVIVLLIFISASPSLVGGFLSKFAIINLVLINLFFFKVNRRIFFIMFFIASLFLAKYFLAIISDSDKVDLYPLVVSLHFYFMVSYPFGNRVYFNSVKVGIGLCFYLGFIASLISLIIGEQFFLFSLANKGLPNVYAFEGFTTTPQAFASLAVLMLILNYNIRSQVRKLFPFLGLLFSINRTLFFGSILVFFYRSLFYLLPVFFLIFIFLGMFSFDAKLFTLQTLLSRIDMLINVSSSFFSMDIFNVIFGTFNSPNFEVHSTGTKYIENGVMFILYYFGLVGFFIYSISTCLFAYIITKHRFESKTKILIYFILVATIVPMLTHEYLYISFYISLIFVVNQVFYAKYDQR